jgi:hypothetical protein
MCERKDVGRIEEVGGVASAGVATMFQMGNRRYKRIEKCERKGSRQGRRKENERRQRERGRGRKEKDKKRTYLSLWGRARTDGGRRKRTALVGELLWAGTQVRALIEATLIAQLQIHYQQRHSYEEEKRH